MKRPASDTDAHSEGRDRDAVVREVVAELHGHDICHVMRDMPSPQLSLSKSVGGRRLVWHTGWMDDRHFNKGDNWLPHYLVWADTNANKVATALGVDRQRISVLAKRTKAIPKEWADRIAPVLGCTPVQLMYGPEGQEAQGTSEDAPPVIQARVAGLVAAGMWLEDSYIDGAVYDPVPIVLARYRDVPQTAYRVRGLSMDLMNIRDGEYVITVPYWVARTAFQDDDVVVVERRDGHKIERTCKQVVVRSDCVELWPRSTQAAFQEPLIVPIDRTADEDGQQVEVVGLVIGKHTVM